MDNKYSNILTLLLIIIVVTIVGICVYYGYDYYSQEASEVQNQKAVEEFNKATSEKKKVVVAAKNEVKEEVVENVVENTTIDYNDLYENIVAELPEVEEPEVQEPQQAIEKQYLAGYEIVGTIKIPKTKIEYPILSQVTKKSLETSVAVLYGPGVNLPGNTVIVGHNYRNNRFFSNNDKLSNGDVVYITDVYGNTVTYKIYNMYYTTANDADYMIREIEEGVREISLSTCNDDSSQRLIIWAREK